MSSTTSARSGRGVAGGPNVGRVRSQGSLDVVEDTVRREFDAQERRADAADTRAGLLLGVAGVLVVSLDPASVWLPLSLVARLLAGVAGLVAMRSFAAPGPPAMDLARLIENVAATDVRATRLLLLDSLVMANTDLGTSVLVKLAHLRLASVLLAAAVGATVVGAMVHSVEGR